MTVITLSARAICFRDVPASYPSVLFLEVMFNMINGDSVRLISLKVAHYSPALRQIYTLLKSRITACFLTADAVEKYIFLNNKPSMFRRLILHGVI